MGWHPSSINAGDTALTRPVVTLLLMVLPAARPAARSHWGAVVRRLPVHLLMPHLVHRLLAAVLGLLLTVSGLAAAVLPAQASQPSTTAGSMTSASTGVTAEVTRAAIAAKGKPTFVTASNKARPGQLSGVVAPAELSGTRYHQLLAHQVAMRATGPMTKSASATAPGSVTPLSHGALLPGPPPAPCPVSNSTNGGTIPYWPNVFNSTSGVPVPCWVSGTYWNGTNYALIPGTGPQNVAVGSTAVFSAKVGSGGFAGQAAGSVYPFAWMLRWDNLFDYWPLMRDFTGQAGNDISGYDFIWQNGIPPSLATDCTVPGSSDYHSGRLVNACNVALGRGPYYGTPDGQALPWTVVVGSDNYLGPVVFNCYQICPGPPLWQGMRMESPVFWQPSPFTGFSWAATGPTDVAFTDGTLSDLPIVSTTWNFGDGTFGSGTNPTHTYSLGGQYTVTETATTTTGQQSVATGTINAAGSLQMSATATPQAIAAGQQTTITVQISNPTNVAVSNVVLGDPTLPSDGVLSISSGPNPANGFTIPAGSSVNVSYQIAASAATLTLGDFVGFTASGDSGAATPAFGSTSVKIIARDALTVSAVTPNTGQLYGGEVLTVAGTGFTDPAGVSTVTSVTIKTPSGDLATTGWVVSGPTSLTVQAPSAETILGQDARLIGDVVVTTALQTSPVSAADAYTYGCQQRSNVASGPWQATGCFNEPTSTSYRSGSQTVVDGLLVTPTTNTATTYNTGSTGTLSSSSTAIVALDLVGNGLLKLVSSKFSWATTTSPVTLTLPSGQTFAGLPSAGTMTLTPAGPGTLNGTVTVTLPPVLGGKTGVVAFTVTQASGLTSVSVTAPNGGNLANLFGLTISSMSLNVRSGTWTIVGTATTSAGPATSFTGSMSYFGGQLTGASLKVGKVLIGGVITAKDMLFSYDATKGWTGAASLEQTAPGSTTPQNAKLSLTFSPAGVMTAGSLTTGPLNLFGAIPVKTFSLTYPAGAWALATTASVGTTGTLSANLGVNAQGQVTGASIVLTNGMVKLFGKMTLNTLNLAYSVDAQGISTYLAAASVSLPGTAVTGVSGSLTITGGKFVAGSLTITGNVPIGTAVFLHSLGAAIKAPTATTGLDICGSVSLTLGPTIAGVSAAELSGAMEYQFPTASGTSKYQMTGQLRIPALPFNNGELGHAALVVGPTAAYADATVALGSIQAGTTCPLKAQRPSTGLDLGHGVRITATITGHFNSNTFLLNGTGTVTYPAIPGLGTGVSGAVAIDSNNITACAKLAGKTGTYGFTLSWGSTAFTTWNGNCPLTVAMAFSASRDQAAQLWAAPTMPADRARMLLV